MKTTCANDRATSGERCGKNEKFNMIQPYDFKRLGSRHIHKKIKLQKGAKGVDIIIY